ncbi:MAG: hypothetical protein EXR79_05515 [Myxococcales bacterium]|nr:hypothetical protein [Myxococcales bacterium]
MRTLVLLNPVAGGRRAGRQWPQFDALFQQHLGPFTLHTTQAAGEASGVVRAALADGVERVISVGGDGTAHEVVNGFFDPATRQPVREGAVFAFIPCGTGGDFRRSFSDFPADTERLVRRIADSQGRPLDVIGTVCAGVEGPAWRVALNVASVGQGGDVARRVNATSKWLSGGAPFVLAGIQGAIFVDAWQVNWRADDGPITPARARHMAVANGRSHGGGMIVAPHAAVDDGRGELVVMGDVNWLQSIVVGLAQYKGKMQSFAQVWQASFERSLEIVPDPGQPDMLVEVDGEVAGRAPVRFEMMKGALRLGL